MHNHTACVSVLLYHEQLCSRRKQHVRLKMTSKTRRNDSLGRSQRAKLVLGVQQNWGFSLFFLFRYHVRHGHDKKKRTKWDKLQVMCCCTALLWPLEEVHTVSEHHWARVKRSWSYKYTNVNLKRWTNLMKMYIFIWKVSCDKIEKKVLFYLFIYFLECQKKHKKHRH